jgi:hypothetical protein
MLWTIAVLLTMLWLLGLVTGYGVGYFIHIPLFIAIIVMLIKIEVDCSDYGTGHREKRYLKGQLASGSIDILPEIATLSAEKISQPIISPPTYEKE